MTRCRTCGRYMADPERAKKKRRAELMLRWSLIWRNCRSK